MQVSIIIVSWNAKDHIRNCLSACLKHIRDISYEIIVSDNGSTDGTVEMIRAEFPSVIVIENKRNIGFGAANNRGVAASSGEMLCFFNDDTVLTENAPRSAYEYMRANPTVGCLGFHLIFPDGSHQDSVRGYPRLIDQTIVLLKLHHLPLARRILRRYLSTDFDYTTEQDVDQVMGACMVIPRMVFQQVEGFDERFFVWFEEVDLQKRIHEDLNLRIVYAPIAEMIHVKGATFGKILSLTNQRRLNRSMRQYFWKHHGVCAAAWICMLTPISMLLTHGVQLLQRNGLDIARIKNKQL